MTTQPPPAPPLALSSRRRPLSTRVQTDALRDLLSLHSQSPRIGLTPAMPTTTIDKQPQTLKAPQQLRDLPLVRDLGMLSHDAITRTRILSHTFKNPRRAIRQTHPHTLERITHPPLALIIH